MPTEQMDALPPLPQQALVSWFLEQARPLPWRQGADPYRVWVSEVMLQQTRAAVVAPYYQRWCAALPTVQDLAEAPWEQVLKLWEGLGYYARARRLQAGARYLCEHHQGQLPRDRASLLAIPGIGPYTASAIQAFAFKEPVGAVDGNVLRVLSRFLASSAPIDVASTQRHFQMWLNQQLHGDSGWIAAEALIELGATVCTPRDPACLQCPMRAGCLAARVGQQEAFPVPRKRPPTEALHVVGLLLGAPGILYLQPPSNDATLFSSLWSLPTFQSHQEMVATLAAWGVAKAPWQGPGGVVQHTFTRYRCTLTPWSLLLHAPLASPPPGTEAVPCDQLAMCSLPAGQRSLLQRWREHVHPHGATDSHHCSIAPSAEALL